jgi:hypothetical protein
MMPLFLAGIRLVQYGQNPDRDTALMGEIGGAHDFENQPGEKWPPEETTPGAKAGHHLTAFSPGTSSNPWPA